MVTSETSTINHPYTRLARSWDHIPFLSPCPMLVGNINQHHFQSLVLRQRISNPAIVNTAVDFTVTRPSYAQVCRTPPKQVCITPTKQITIETVPHLSAKIRLINDSPTCRKKVKLNSTIRKDKRQDVEAELEQSCAECGVTYVAPAEQESNNERKNRRRRLRRNIQSASDESKQYKSHVPLEKTETELKEKCLDSGISFIPACDGESKEQTRVRRKQLRRDLEIPTQTHPEDIHHSSKNQVETNTESKNTTDINSSTNQIETNNASMQEETMENTVERDVNVEAPVNTEEVTLEDVDMDESVTNEDNDELHGNPAVAESVKTFEEGELLHGVAKCKVCLENI